MDGGSLPFTIADIVAELDAHHRSVFWPGRRGATDLAHGNAINTVYYHQ